MFKFIVFFFMVAVAVAKPSIGYYSSPVVYSSSVVGSPSVTTHSKTDYHNENSHSAVGGGVVGAVAAQPVVASYGAIPDPSAVELYSNEAPVKGTHQTETAVFTTNNLILPVENNHQYTDHNSLFVNSNVVEPVKVSTTFNNENGPQTSTESYTTAEDVSLIEKNYYSSTLSSSGTSVDSEEPSTEPQSFSTDSLTPESILLSSTSKTNEIPDKENNTASLEHVNIPTTSNFFTSFQNQLSPNSAVINIDQPTVYVGNRVSSSPVVSSLEIKNALVQSGLKVNPPELTSQNVLVSSYKKNLSSHTIDVEIVPANLVDSLNRVEKEELLLPKISVTYSRNEPAVTLSKSYNTVEPPNISFSQENVPFIPNIVGSSSNSYTSTNYSNEESKSLNNIPNYLSPVATGDTASAFKSDVQFSPALPDVENPSSIVSNVETDIEKLKLNLQTQIPSGTITLPIQAFGLDNNIVQEARPIVNIPEDHASSVESSSPSFLSNVEGDIQNLKTKLEPQFESNQQVVSYGSPVEGSYSQNVYDNPNYIKPNVLIENVGSTDVAGNTGTIIGIPGASSTPEFISNVQEDVKILQQNIKPSPPLPFSSSSFENEEPQNVNNFPNYLQPEAGAFEQPKFFVDIQETSSTPSSPSFISKTEEDIRKLNENLKYSFPLNNLGSGQQVVSHNPSSYKSIEDSQSLVKIQESFLPPVVSTSPTFLSNIESDINNLRQGLHSESPPISSLDTKETVILPSSSINIQNKVDYSVENSEDRVGSVEIPAVLNIFSKTNYSNELNSSYTPIIGNVSPHSSLSLSVPLPYSDIYSKTDCTHEHIHTITSPGITASTTAASFYDPNSVAYSSPVAVAPGSSVSSHTKTDYHHEAARSDIGGGTVVADSSYLAEPAVVAAYNAPSVSYSSPVAVAPGSSVSSHVKTDYHHEASHASNNGDVAVAAYRAPAAAYSSSIAIVPRSSVKSYSKTTHHTSSSIATKKSGAAATSLLTASNTSAVATPVAAAAAPVAVAPAGSVSSHSKTDYHHEDSTHQVGGSVAAVAAAPVVPAAPTAPAIPVVPAAPIVAAASAPAVQVIATAAAVPVPRVQTIHTVDTVPVVHAVSSVHNVAAAQNVAAVHNVAAAQNVAAIRTAPVAYSAPAVTYSAPAVAYSNPVVIRKVAVAAPSYVNEVAYSAPVYARRYYSPQVVSYAANPVHAYAAPVAYAAGPASSSSSRVRSGSYLEEDRQHTLY